MRTQQVVGEVEKSRKKFRYVPEDDYVMEMYFSMLDDEE